ncbi:MAG TPA: histidine kinase [Puia sp.]|nr:histidine kinase [Puia sp.]
MNHSGEFNKKFKIAFACWWLAWAALQYSVLANYGLTTIQAFVDSTVSNCLLAGGCLLIGSNMRYYLPGKEKYWYVLAISLALSLMWLLLIRILLGTFFKDDAAYISILSRSLIIRFGVALLMMEMVTTMSLLWYSQKEQKGNEERKNDAERLSKEAELFKLRQQLQPHFLFNSLNSINALIAIKPEEARKMIQQLSDFLRGTIRKEDQQWVNFSEELQYLKLYLDIEKVRFGHRLSDDIICEEAAQTMKLPPMLLQPIVENAIKFGLYDTIGDITIRIIAGIKEDHLEVIVENPFDPETSHPKQGTGFGLNSVKRRLLLLFARNDLLQTKIEDNLFTTIVKIPQVI